MKLVSWSIKLQVETRIGLTKMRLQNLAFTDGSSTVHLLLSLRAQLSVVTAQVSLRNPPTHAGGKVSTSPTREPLTLVAPHEGSGVSALSRGHMLQVQQIFVSDI